MKYILNLFFCIITMCSCAQRTVTNLDRWIDGSMVAAANIAIGKAATVVGFKRPGKVLEKAVSDVRVAMQTLGNVTPYPIIIEEQMVGGISVAGAENGDNDEIIVCYAIDQFLSESN